MPNFMSDGFLLESEKAKKLYGYVKDLPIYDYHCHLSPKEIFDDKKFFNLTELWLNADHYKWRVMRNAGVAEKYITGNAEDFDKFFAFASVLPDFIANPVYHWAHLELKQYFNITMPLSAHTAKEIWDKTKIMMADGSYSARKLIEKSNVKTVITTDDPCDDLSFHIALKSSNLPFNVKPCFRLDNAVNIEKDAFLSYLERLQKATNCLITSLDDYMKSIENRLEFFKNHSCTAADCSFEDFPNAAPDKEVANSAFEKRIAGENLSEIEIDELKFEILSRLLVMLKKHNFVCQLHTAVVRNQNTARFLALGADCGIDSIGNAVNIVSGAKLLDNVSSNGGLPKMIVYTLNPNSYYPIASLLGDFAGDSRGSMQLGAAWWFLDHRDGIKEQLRIFSSINGLGLFNGMLTDSRSFVSYARHDYFRRILCSAVGEWVESGEYPDDETALKNLVSNICYNNAKNFFE